MSDYFDRPSDTSTHLPKNVELPIKHDEEYFDRPHETATYNPYEEELPISDKIIIHHPEEGHWEAQNAVVWIGDTTGGGTFREGWTPTTSSCSITTTASYLKDSYRCAYRTGSSSGYVKFSHEQLALTEGDKITFICWHQSNSSARNIYLYINDNRVATFQQPKSQTTSNTFVYTITEDTNIESVRIQGSGSSNFMTYEVRCDTNVWVVDVPAWDEVVTIPPDKYFDRPHETSTYTPADTPLPDEEVYASAEDDMDNVTDEKDLSAVINLLEQAIDKL